MSLVNNCTEVGGLFHHDKDKTDLAQGGCFPAGILESYFHMLMEKEKPQNLPLIVGSIASVIKLDQILHQQPVRAGQKTFISKLPEILSHPSLPHSCTDTPKHGVHSSK